MSESRSISKELEVAAAQVVEAVRQLIHAGNVRRLRIEHDGTTMVDLPLTVIAVGAIVAPAVAVLGALAAVVSKSRVAVVRDEDPSTGLEEDPVARLQRG